jgi:low temperature requirement protein LtrA
MCDDVLSDDGPDEHRPMTDRSDVSPATRPAWRRMVARDAGEANRVATPLELFFDLCFVVAVAEVSSQLHHYLAEGHAWPGGA